MARHHGRTAAVGLLGAECAEAAKRGGLAFYDMQCRPYPYFFLFWLFRTSQLDWHLVEQLFAALPCEPAHRLAQKASQLSAKAVVGVPAQAKPRAKGQPSRRAALTSVFPHFDWQFSQAQMQIEAILSGKKIPYKFHVI